MIKSGYLKITKGIYINTQRNSKITIYCTWTLLAVLLNACATSLPEARHEHYSFPESKAYVEEPTGRFQGMPFKPLGWVKAKATNIIRVMDVAANTDDYNSVKDCIAFVVGLA